LALAAREGIRFWFFPHLPCRHATFVADVL
jgi:hypothetical protein